MTNSQPCDGCQGHPCICDPPLTRPKKCRRCKGVGRPGGCGECGYRGNGQWAAPVDDPPLTRPKRRPPVSAWDALRAHGVMLSDAQLDDLLAIARVWNRDRNDRHLPALTPYQALGEILKTTRGLVGKGDP